MRWRWAELKQPSCFQKRVDRWAGRFPVLACASFAVQEGQVLVRRTLGERGRLWTDEA